MSARLSQFQTRAARAWLERGSVKEAASAIGVKEKAVENALSALRRKTQMRRSPWLAVWLYKNGIGKPLALASVFLALTCLAFVPNSPTQITLVWDAQTNADVFKVYASPDLATWSVLTNVPGTNTSIALQMVPQRQFFYLTASNFWGESGPSNIIGTPAAPLNVTNLTIKRP